MQNRQIRELKFETVTLLLFFYFGEELLKKMSAKTSTKTVTKNAKTPKVLPPAGNRSISFTSLQISSSDKLPIRSRASRGSMPHDINAA